MSDFPKLLYIDGDLSKDFIEVETSEQEAQGNAEGFFFHVTHREITDAVQNANEGQAPAEEEVTGERAALRAAYLERFGKPAPGRMSDDSLRAALAGE